MVNAEFLILYYIGSSYRAIDNNHKWRFILPDGMASQVFSLLCKMSTDISGASVYAVKGNACEL